MKTNYKGLFQRTATVALVIMILSLATTGSAAGEIWNKGQKASFVPSSSDTTCSASNWTSSLVDLYQLNWYENPTRRVLKGEFMLVQLRTIQASLERRGLDQLFSNKETLDFKDSNTLTESAQEEAKILKYLGILSGTAEGYMNLTSPIKRSEAAKVLAVTNSKVLDIPSIKNPKAFKDTKGHWAEKSISIAYQISLLNGMSDTIFKPDELLTLEQTLQILENEVGYFGITRVDVAKAMNETFKVALNTDVSNSVNTVGSFIKYEEKMKNYQFDKMYDNQSANSSEYVTKAEALKMAIAAVLNTNDISNYIDSTNAYENAIWVEYSKLFEVTDEDINSSNYYEKATYIDVISYFENCKNYFLDKQPIKDATLHLKDMEKYSAKEQAALKDMVANKIVYLRSDTLNGNEYISKGQLNEITVNFVERYNTIVMEGDTINTSPEDMPSNASLYPYILSNVDKRVYELPFFVNDNRSNLSPKELYVYKKNFYPQIKLRCEEYFNELLNIDYRTITEESLRAKIETYYIFDATDAAVKKYVKHVKDNQIILTGNSQVQFPAVYFDGSTFRVRMRLQFEVVSSNTKDSLIYLDMLDGLKETYTKKNYDIIADCSMSNAIGNNNLYIDEVRLYNGILDKGNCGIIKEAENKTIR